MSIEEPPVSFVCIHGPLGTSANPGALTQCATYVELPWRTCPARWTGASDAARRGRCLSGQSERWGASDWQAGGTVTSLHR